LRDVVTGFPWLAFGYAQIPSGPFVALAPVIGVFGVSLASAIAAGLLAIAAGLAIAPHLGFALTREQPLAIAQEAA